MKNQIDKTEKEIDQFFEKMQRDGLMIGTLSLEDLNLFEKNQREACHLLYKKLDDLIYIEQESIKKVPAITPELAGRYLANERIRKILGMNWNK